MSRNKTEQDTKVPTHVVSLYDYIPGETEVPDIGNMWLVAPHVAMHLDFLKGETFKLIGNLDWWLYVTSSSGNTGYIPSVLTAPLKTECLNPEYCKVLSHHGDVPFCVIDAEVDLHYFPETPLDRSTELHNRKLCPEKNANIFSFLTFWWMTRKLKKRSFEKTTANGTTSDELQGLHDKDVKFSNDIKKKVIQPSVIKNLFKISLPYLLPAALFKLCHDVLLLVQPQLLGAIVNFIEDKEIRPAWEGFLYAVAMFLVAMFQTLVLGQYFRIVMVTGMRIRSAMLGAVYRKALVLSTTSRNQSTVGEMVNLMSVDAQRLMDIVAYLNMIWSSPFQIILAIVFLYRAIGISVLAGVGIMALIFPLNFFTGRLLRRFQVKQMNIKDSRIKLMNEILSGIKVLKLFAWETSFMAKILGIRKLELRQLRYFSYLQAGYSFLWTSVPFLVSLASFGTYVLLGNTLTASKAFVALALFNILRFPLSMWANLLSSIIQAMVSAKRLQKFLNMDELDPNHVQRTSDDETKAIQIIDGTFSWEYDDKPTLAHIDLKVDKGLLVAVVGHVGCGKSSLLSAMLGDIRKLEGKVYLQGSVAYVPQQAWIQNTTVRENILFGKPYDPKRYHKVIDNCSLIPDLEILPGGDMTEIGEKGINLSGGQKQRVSLARAVYNNADVYLLDDPLSAVDSHVGKDMFDHIIGPKGMLKKKTRVFVTHQIRFLSQVDRVVVLRKGAITEVGSYSELLANNGDFAEFVRTYAKEHEDDSDQFEPRLRALSHLSAASFNKDVYSRDRSSTIGSMLSDVSREELEFTELERQAREDNKMIEEEKAETGRVKSSVFLYYFASSGTLLSLIMFLFFLICEASIAGSRLWLAHWSSSNVTSNSEQKKFVGVYGALGAGQGFFLFLGASMLAFLCIKCSKKLHQNLLNNILRLPMSFYETTPLGRIVNRFSKDIDGIDMLIPANLYSFLATFVKILGTMFLICYSTPLFLIVLIPLCVLYTLVQRLYVATSRQLQRLESISRSPIFSHFFETINGVTTIRAFGAQGRFISLNDANVDENQMAAFPNILCNRWLSFRLESVGNFVIFFAALFGVLARGNIESGLIGLSITVALNVTQNLYWLVKQTSELETNIVSVERVKEYTETSREASWINASKRPANNWPEKGEIEIRNLGIRYREGLNLALMGVDCDIHSNEKIGLVGRTGSGKSTFAMSLFRVIEAATGSIVIDSVNIADIGLHDLRSRITIIPQDPILFSASLRFNLDPFDKHSDEEIWTVLEVTHLKSFVTGLDKNLDYLIAEGGENLSVGQRQLVCLARALLRRTKILVLDEATAAVDLETDELIQQTIRKEFAECTVLTIAHRLNTIMDYTRIIVLSEGQIIEFDTPKKLLELKGVFYGMAKDSNLVS